MARAASFASSVDSAVSAPRVAAAKAIASAEAERTAKGRRRPRPTDVMEAHKLVKQTKTTTTRSGERRDLHRPDVVAAIHGALLYGTDPSMPDKQHMRSIVKQTGFSRKELYRMFAQFKALVAMSSRIDGIDKETFTRYLPGLGLEDSKFANRVFMTLDEDGSDVIEWDEFLKAMRSLELGTAREKAFFLFRVYDDDGGGSIDSDEMQGYFLSSLRIDRDKADEYVLREIGDYFVERVLDDIDPDNKGELKFESVLQYIKDKGGDVDVPNIFGRATVDVSTSNSVLSALSDEYVGALLDKHAHLPLTWVLAERRAREEEARRTRKVFRDAEMWRRKKAEAEAQRKKDEEAKAAATRAQPSKQTPAATRADTS